MRHFYAIEYQDGYYKQGGSVKIHKFSTKAERDSWVADMPESAYSGFAIGLRRKASSRDTLMRQAQKFGFSTFSERW